MKTFKLLLATHNDKEPGLLSQLLIQAQHGTRPTLYQLITEDSFEKTIKRAKYEIFDIILLSFPLSFSSGEAVLQQFLSLSPSPTIIVLGYNLDGAVFLRAGAQDYLNWNHLGSQHLVRSLYHAIERKKYDRP